MAVRAREAEPRQLRCELTGLDARVGRRLGDRAQDLRLDHGRPGRLLERGDVLLGHAPQVVLRADVSEGSPAHLVCDAGLRQALHGRGQRTHLLVASHRHLQRDLVGQLAEPAEIADDERLAERQRADCAPRRLAHGRRTQQYAGVARLHQRPQALLLDIGLANHALPVEAEPLEPAVEVEPRRLGADEQQPRSGMGLTELGERAQELRNPLALVQVPEAAEQRRALDRRGLDVGRRPRRVRDPPQRAGVAMLSRALLDVARVRDHPGRLVEHLSSQGELGRADLPERRHAAFEDAPAEHAAGHARLAFHRGEIGMAVVPPHRHPRDEVVDDEVVHDDDARPPA